MLGLLVLLFLLGDLFHQIVLQSFGFIQHCLILFALFNELTQQLIGFLPLGFLLCLRCVQSFLGCLQRRLFHFQIRTGGFHILGSLLQLLQPPLVGRRDLLHHVDPVQQVGKAVGLKQHRPVREAALFFHGTDTLFVLLIQLRQMISGHIQLVLLVRDQQTESGDLTVDIGDLGSQQRNLLIDQIFLGNDILDLVFILFIFTFQFFDLLFQLFIFFFHLGDLILDLAGRSGFDRHRDHVEYHRQHQQTSQYCRAKPAFFHKRSP